MNTSGNDQVLIKSEVDKKVKTVFLAVIAATFVVFAILFFSMFEKGDYVRSYREITQLEAAFKVKDEYIVKFIITCAFFLIGGVLSIIYWAISRCSLTVTEKNVKGKTLFGKEVVLPLYMVSAYSTGKLFSTIAVATSSGVTKFSMIANYVEIGEILGQRINERQESTTNEATTKAQPAPQGNAMDDILKLKALLDAGAITQEEFDAKKKELLGL